VLFLLCLCASSYTLLQGGSLATTLLWMSSFCGTVFLLVSVLRHSDSVCKYHLPDQQSIHGFLSIGQIATSPPVTITVKVNSRDIEFEMDTGASVTVISFKSFKLLFPDCDIKQSNLILHSLSGNIRNAGESMVSVQYNHKVFR